MKKMPTMETTEATRSVRTMALVCGSVKSIACVSFKAIVADAQRIMKLKGDGL